MTRPLTTLRNADDLVAAGLVPETVRARIDAVAERYAVAIPPAITALIDRHDASDPIARQFVPDPRELVTTADERADPIGDDAHAPVKGIVHRYPDRVLLKLANVCPVYCRFCFRRASVGNGVEASLSADEIAAALAYVASRPQIREVIVTGGDPLILSARRLGEVTRAIAAIAHVAVIRWHSRVPVVAPERITRGLVGALTDAHEKQVVVAIHANHARELSRPALAAIAALRAGGIMLLSQSVLLKGINDDADTLEALMRALIAAGVKPYYLHHGDLAPGTAHLRTTIAEGEAIMRELRRHLSGIALPAYVLDIPGGHGKVPIDTDHVGPLDPVTGVRHVVDPWGGVHPYRDLGANSG